MLNTQLLRQRLQMIEHYKYQHGIEIARWPHFFMKRAGSHLYKFKFNYAIKAAALFMVYRDYSQYRYLQTQVFLPIHFDNYCKMSIAAKSGAFVGLCLVI